MHLKTWRYPAELKRNPNFRFFVEDDGKWHEIEVLSVPVDHEKNGGPFESAMVFFEFDGKRRFKISTNENIQSHEFRPNIATQDLDQNDKELIFGLEQRIDIPLQFVIRLNESWNTECLHVFTRHPEEKIPTPNQVDYFFEAGKIHEIGELDLNHTGGKRVYLEAGSVVRGQIRAHNAKDLKIFGRGMFEEGSIRSEFGADNIRIEGIVLRHVHEWCLVFENRGENPNAELPHNIHLSNLSIVTHSLPGERSCPDAIHLDACKNSSARNCFIRGSDDLLNADSRDHGLDMHDVLFENMVLWCDVGHAMMVAYRGAMNTMHTNARVHFKNIDVINNVGGGVGGGIMQIYVPDNLIVRDIHFEDIRIYPLQKPESTRSISIDMRSNHWSMIISEKDTFGLAVRDIRFEKIDDRGGSTLPCEFIGKSHYRNITGVSFIDYRREGNLVQNLDELHAECNEYCHEFSFKNESPDERIPSRLIPPLDLDSPIPHACNALGEIAINFSARDDLPAGSPFPITQIRPLEGSMLRGEIHVTANNGETHERIPLSIDENDLGRATIPAELTSGTFDYHLEITCADGSTVREPRDPREISVTLSKADCPRIVEISSLSHPRGATLQWKLDQEQVPRLRYRIIKILPDGSSEKLITLPGEERHFTLAFDEGEERCQVEIQCLSHRDTQGEKVVAALQASDNESHASTLDVHALKEEDMMESTTGWGKVLFGKNGANHPLKHEVEYADGIGVHTNSRLTFKIPASAKRFQCSVGIDDIQYSEALAVGEIHIGGKCLAQSPVMKKGDELWPLVVDIPVKSKELTLVAREGHDEISFALVNWISAAWVISK